MKDGETRRCRGIHCLRLPNLGPLPVASFPAWMMRKSQRSAPAVDVIVRQYLSLIPVGQAFDSVEPKLSSQRSTQDPHVPLASDITHLPIRSPVRLRHVCSLQVAIRCAHVLSRLSTARILGPILEQERRRSHGRTAFRLPLDLGPNSARMVVRASRNERAPSI